MKNNSATKSFFPRMLLFTLLLLSGAAAFSQSARLPQGKSTIIMKDGKQIDGAQLWAVHPGILEYEKRESLHDVIIDEIKIIKAEQVQWFFDSSGTLIKVLRDLIITTRDDSMPCEILSVSDVLTFRLFTMYDEPYQSYMQRSEVKKFFINGEEKFFPAADTSGISTAPAEKIIPILHSAMTSEHLYNLGWKDGKKYYNGTGAAIGGAVSGIVPFLGWMVTMPIIAATSPNMYNTDNPNFSKISDKNYQKGYRKAANAKKLENVFAGFGIGLSLSVMLFFAL